MRYLDTIHLEITTADTISNHSCSDWWMAPFRRQDLSSSTMIDSSCSVPTSASIWPRVVKETKCRIWICATHRGCITGEGWAWCSPPWGLLQYSKSNHLLYISENHRVLRRSQKTWKFYKKLIVSRNSFVALAEMCRDKNRSILMDWREVIERWKEHFDEHLNGAESASNDDPNNEGNVYISTESIINSKTIKLSIRTVLEMYS